MTESNKAEALKESAVENVQMINGDEVIVEFSNGDCVVLPVPKVKRLAIEEGIRTPNS